MLKDKGHNSNMKRHNSKCKFLRGGDNGTVFH